MARTVDSPIASNPRIDRLREIDLLKGIAIVAVICIHARVFRGTYLHDHVVNRAVPIFLFVFGLTADRSLRRHRGAEGNDSAVIRWGLGRLRRLLPGVWVAMGLWWLVAVMAGMPGDAVWPDVLAVVVGYCPGFGTSWFVTLILQLVLLVPLVRWLWDRFGAPIAVGLGAASTLVSIWHIYDIIELGQAWLAPDQVWYHFWIFGPRALWYVTVGITLGRLGHRPPKWLTVASAVLVLSGPLFVEAATGFGGHELEVALYHQAVMYALDLPLVLMLLGLLHHAPPPRWLDRPLAWCGRRTWGLYLVHALAFEVLHLLGIAPEMGAWGVRLVFALCLLGLSAGGLVAAETLWQRGRRLPELRLQP